MRAVDTNVLVRLITRDDAAQAAAADTFIQPGAWVPQVALVEAAGVRSAVYELTPSAIATAFDMLLNHGDLTLQDAEVVGAALEIFRRKPALGFSDCLMVEIARKAGHLPFGTFDRTLGKVDGAERI